MMLCIIRANGLHYNEVSVYKYFFLEKKNKTNKTFNSHLNTCTVEFLIYVTLYGLTSSYMLLQRTPADNRDLKYRTVQEK